MANHSIDSEMVGRMVCLSPVMPTDGDFLYDLMIADEANFQWRFRGMIPSYETFADELWSGVWCQYIVSTKRTLTPIGIVVAYGANLHTRHVYVGGIAIKSARLRGFFPEGFALFLDHLRNRWDFKKFYFEVPEFNSHQFGRALTGGLTEEARLRDYLFFAGRHWDMSVLSLDVERKVIGERPGVSR